MGTTWLYQGAPQRNAIDRWVLRRGNFQAVSCVARSAASGGEFAVFFECLLEKNMGK